MSICNVPRRKDRKNYRDPQAIAGVGMKIRQARLSRELSIEALANECELDPTQVSRMELGKVDFNISNLYLIAKVLQVHPSTLIP